MQRDDYPDMLADREIEPIRMPEPLNITGVPLAVTYDPVVDIDAQKTYLIEKGGATSTFQPTVSTNFSNSQIQFKVNTPSVNDLLDPLMYVSVPVQMTFTGPAPGAGNLLKLNQGVWALRSFAFNKCINTAAIQINNQNITANPVQYVNALERSRLYQKNFNQTLSSFPALPDNSQTYAQLNGGTNNVLNSFASSDYWQQGRGAFPVTVSANTPTAATINFTLVEPIFMSPLAYASDSKQQAFASLTNFNVTLTLGNLVRMLSYDTTNGNALTNVTATIQSAPTLLCRFITPQQTMQIPEKVSYPIEIINSYTNPAVSLGAAASTTITSQNLTLSTVPGRIYVWAQRQSSDLQSATGYQYTDSFARITSCSVTFNNVAGLLSSATEADLWRISSRNGINIGYHEWIGTGPSSVADAISPIGVGSVLAIKPVEDFGMPDTIAPGLYGKQFNFQARIGITNISSATVPYELIVVVIDDGVLTIFKGGNAILQEGMLTQEDILNAPILPVIKYNESISPWGGDFWSDLKRVGSDVWTGIKDVAPKVWSAAKEVAPYVAPLLALGKKSGAARVGGRAVSMNELRRRIGMY